jgi:hypothetical protein
MTVLKDILRQVAAGEMTVEEAEATLGRIEAKEEGAPAASGPGPGSAESWRGALRIVVERSGVKPVNVRMPFTFPANAGKIFQLVSPFLRRRLSLLGINASTLGNMNWAELLKSGNIEVDQGTQKVKIFVES